MSDRLPCRESKKLNHLFPIDFLIHFRMLAKPASKVGQRNNRSAAKAVEVS
jgi:hypothetical protein